jgi:hypothetical protein
MPNLNRPKPPTVIPVLFLMTAAILGLTYWTLNQLGWPGWLVLGLSPLSLAMLPAEIRYSLRRRRICEHIQMDFADEDVGLETDYEMMLAEIRNPTISNRHSRRKRKSRSSTTSWPSTAAG